MNIDFEWKSTNLARAKKEEVEQNISSEIEAFEHFNDFPAPPDKLRVTLSGDRLLLSGIAKNTNGEGLVNITYLIDFPHKATYDYVKPLPTVI